MRARVGDETLIMAEALVERVLGEGVETSGPVDVVGLAYEPPFPYISDYGERGHTVLPADFVTTDEGTGVVHTAVAFGEDDFRLGEAFGLKVQNPVRPNGTFDERIEPFAGRSVKEADPDIVEALRESGRLLRAEDYEHSYPHCWRCETPLLYYAKSSWYVRTTAVKDALLASNESVTWHPDHVKHGRFGNWLENNVDWALSRERYWGTPLPVWRSEDGEDVVCVGSRAELAELGAEVPEDLHRPYVDDVTFERGGKTYRRVPDLIDVWWDSGCMPFAQWHAPFENQEVFEARFPADYICEGLDQTRGWFYSLLAVSTLLFGRSSYETVLCLGLVLDGEGQKMSKSKGNAVAPWEVLDAHGADAMRWYYFTSKQPWDGYRFSLETVGESVRQFMKTLWNTYGFFVLYANVNDVEPAAVDEVELTDIDRWALSRLQATAEVAIERLDDYDTTAAGRAIAAFVDDLSNWYVRRSRRRFWDGDPAAFATLRECLLGVAKLAAPLVPFITDSIYGNLDGAEPSVHLCDYPQPGGARHRPRAADGAGARGGGPGPRGAGARQAQGPPAAARGGGGGRRARARRHRALRGAPARGAEREGGALRVGGRRARPLRAQAQLPRARPALREAHAQGGRGGGRARRGAGRAHAARGRRGARGHRRTRPRARGRRPIDGPPAARGLPGGALGLARGGARPHPRRRPPARGAGPRGGARGAERPQGVGARRGGQDRARPRRRRGPALRGARARGLRDRRDARNVARPRRRRTASRPRSTAASRVVDQASTARATRPRSGGAPAGVVGSPCTTPPIAHSLLGESTKRIQT